VPYPVSVIVPAIPERKQFRERFGFPSIRANDPAELIVEHDEHPFKGANALRNAGAKRATQELLAFVDDDVVLATDFLRVMCHALLENPSAGYAYCDSTEIVFPGAPISYGRGSHQRPGDFDPKRLCKSNYISTMSVVRRTVFPGFDAEIRRLQDWDLWLTMLGKGVYGIYVPQCLFWNCHIDVGITAREPKDFWHKKIIAKHATTMRRHA
jgi:hypothetical protein